MTTIAENIANVRERCEAAARRAGRSPQEITLLAVSKRASPESILAAYQAGATRFGESYIQEAKAKIGVPPLDKPEIQWHLIGRLQSNKVKEAIGRFALIQSVDSIRIAQEISKRAETSERPQDILLEVKLDESPAKCGFHFEEMEAATEQIAALKGVRIQGLMGMAPFDPSEKTVRAAFQTLYKLFERLPASMRQTLSMGMTGDFEIAIEEGATLVRIGTAIFGSRSQAKGL